MATSFANVGELRKEILKLLISSPHKQQKSEVIIRLIVYLRDELRCVYCREDYSGKTASLSLDHVVPSSKCGGSHIDNLVTSCKRCNEKKANSVFPEKASALVSTMMWQINKFFLKHLDFEPRAMEALEAVIASVGVRVFWQGQQHEVIEWRNGFMLRNMYTGECMRIHPPAEKQEMVKESDDKKKKRFSAYERLEKIMHTLGITPDEINY